MIQGSSKQLTVQRQQPGVQVLQEANGSLSRPRETPALSGGFSFCACVYINIQ